MGTGFVADERSELHPISLYAEKKAEAEDTLFALPAPGMSITALRMATLYGLSPRMRFDLAVNLFDEFRYLVMSLRLT